MNRRDWLASGGAVVGGMMAGSVLYGAQSAQTTSDDTVVWQYEPLDPVATAELAYALYPDGSCMYASFRSIVSSVGEIRAKNHPEEKVRWEQFPFHMMRYGRGGVHDYGTLCGILNGCAAAISLFVSDKKAAAAMTRELFAYYESTMLPVYVPTKSKVETVEQSVSGSPLCHVSLSHWIAESHAEVESPRRKERCKRLVCDHVIKTVQMLNRYTQSVAAGTTCAFASDTEPMKSCVACHSPEGESPDTNARMNCATCHEDTMTDFEKKRHPVTAKKQ